VGFKRKRSNYKLTFADGHELSGLVVVMKSTSVGRLIELQRLGEQAGGADDDTAPPEALEEMVQLLADGIVEWNLEDEHDRPIPPGRDALMDEDPAFLMALIEAWSQAMSGVSDDLGKDSTSGESFPEESLPMETLSPSLAS
jgi:hypothetical protein